MNEFPDGIRKELPEKVPVVEVERITVDFAEKCAGSKVGKAEGETFLRRMAELFGKMEESGFNPGFPFHVGDSVREYLPKDHPGSGRDFLTLIDGNTGKGFLVLGRSLPGVGENGENRRYVEFCFVERGHVKRSVLLPGIGSVCSGVLAALRQLSLSIEMGQKISVREKSEYPDAYRYRLFGFSPADERDPAALPAGAVEIVIPGVFVETPTQKYRATVGINPIVFYRKISSGGEVSSEGVGYYGDLYLDEATGGKYYTSMELGEDPDMDFSPHFNAAMRGAGMSMSIPFSALVPLLSFMRRSLCS